MNTSRLTIGLAAVAASIATACGDDSGTSVPDARTRRIDAAVSVPDAPNPPDAAPPPIDAPPPVAVGENCANPEPIVFNAGIAVINSTTLGLMSNHTPGECVKVNSAGPDKVFSVTIPAGNRLAATVDPVAGTFDPGIYLIATPAANCDVEPAVCLTANDTGGDGASDLITHDNPGAAALNAYLIIDGFRAEGDAFTLTANLITIPPP